MGGGDEGGSGCICRGYRLNDDQSFFFQITHLIYAPVEWRCIRRHQPRIIAADTDALE